MLKGIEKRLRRSCAEPERTRAVLLRQGRAAPAGGEAGWRGSARPPGEKAGSGVTQATHGHPDGDGEVICPNADANVAIVGCEATTAPTCARFAMPKSVIKNVCGTLEPGACAKSVWQSTGGGNVATQPDGLATWDKHGLRPFDQNRRAEVRMVLLFADKDTLFVNAEDHVIARITDKKDVNEMLMEAAMRNLISSSTINYDHGPRPEGYPKTACSAVWLSHVRADMMGIWNA